MKKYELTDETLALNGDTILHRIRALISFKDVQAGDFGGFVESEANLSQEGDAWVCDNAWVSDNALVSGNAQVFGDAWVSGNARVSGNASVSRDAQVSGNAQVFGDEV